MEYFWIWLLVTLDAIKVLLWVFTILPGTIFGIFTIACLVTSEHPHPVKWKPVGVWFLPVWIPLVILAAITPDTQKAAIIFGAGAVIKAVTSEKGQEVAGRMGSALESKLYEILEVKTEVEKPQ